MENIIYTLFSTHAEKAWKSDTILDNTPLFNENDLLIAANSLQSMKVLGPDGILTEVLKAVANTCKQMLLNMYNCFLSEGASIGDGRCSD